MRARGDAADDAADGAARLRYVEERLAALEDRQGGDEVWHTDYPIFLNGVQGHGSTKIIHRGAPLSATHSWSGIEANPRPAFLVGGCNFPPFAGTETPVWDQDTTVMEIPLIPGGSAEGWPAFGTMVVGTGLAIDMRPVNSRQSSGGLIHPAGYRPVVLHHRSTNQDTGASNIVIHDGLPADDSLAHHAVYFNTPLIY